MDKEILKISALNTLCISIAFAGYQWSINTFHLEKILFPSTICLVVSYVIIRHGAKKYAYKKMVSAYKNMYENQTVNIKSNLPNMSSVETLSKQMMEYATTKNKEINELKVRENYRKEFMVNVSHELRTPLFNIQGFIHTLIDGAMNNKNVLKDYLDRANRNIERLMTTVEELDTISKYEHGQIKLKKRKFDIVFLTKEVFDLLSNKAKKNNIKLCIDKKYTTCMVYADRDKIEQVLINLIDNSIKYARKNQAETQVSLELKQNSVLIHVRDNGEGISKKELSKIFERFYRIDKSRSRKKGGSGLGLAIVKHIINAHNENIFVKSKPKEGSVFSFSTSRVNSK